MRFFYFCGTPSLLVVAVTIKFVLVLGYMVESIWASESSQTSVVQVTTGDSSSSKGNTTSGTRKLEKCDNGNLSQCWNQIPPFPDQGIPSSPQGVEAACRYGKLFPSYSRYFVIFCWKSHVFLTHLVYVVVWEVETLPSLFIVFQSAPLVHACHSASDSPVNISVTTCQLKTLSTIHLNGRVW